MLFRVLGPVALMGPDGWHTPPGALQRGLLGMLLASANQAVSVDVLVNGLWGPERVEGAHARLQVHVHRLRKELDEPERLSLASEGYVLRVGPAELDAATFDDLVGRALAPGLPPEEAVGLADEALELWRGEPYSGGPVDAVRPGVVETERSRLTSRRLTLHECRFSALLVLDRPGEVIDDLSVVAERDPLHEGLAALLVRALEAAGRRSDALAAFRRIRSALVEELGIEPGPELRTLHERILLGESSGTPASGPAPAQLPSGPTDLVGRDAALAALDETLLGIPRSTIAVVVGTAGVGKTSTALAWAGSRRDRFPDGQLYCDLRGFSADAAADPATVLAAFIRALGGTASSRATLDEHSALFRSLCSTRRLLVVLDNAASVEQVRPLLPGAAGCVVLVTSRVTLGGLAVREGAHQLGLAPLRSDVAGELLLSALGDRSDSEPQLLTELVQHCAGLPLALRITAEQLRQRPEQDLASFAAEIADEEARLDLLDLGDDASSMRAVLSWSYDALPHDERGVLRAFGCLPGPDADVGALAALAGLRPRLVLSALATLARTHLVDQPRPGRYQQHDVLRAFAGERARAEIAVAERAASRTRLLEYYVATLRAVHEQLFPSEYRVRQFDAPVLQETSVPDFPDREAARAWIDAQLADFIACAVEHDRGTRHSRDDDVLVGALARMVFTHMTTSGGSGAAVPLFTTCMRAADRLQDGETWARAAMMLGVALFQAGETDAGDKWVQQALEVALADGHRHLAASCLANLGNLASNHYRDEDAVALQRQARELFLEEGDAKGANRSLMNLAAVLNNMGELEEARSLTEQALEQARGLNDERVIATALHVLADVHLGLHSLDRADEVAEQAIEHAQRHGLETREGDLLTLKGRILVARGEPSAAVPLFTSAYEIAQKVRHDTIALESLIGCGEALAECGSPDALSYFVEAHALALRVGNEAMVNKAASRLSPSVPGS